MNPVDYNPRKSKKETTTKKTKKKNLDNFTE